MEKKTLSRIVPLNVNIATQVQDRSANLQMMRDVVGGEEGGGEGHVDCRMGKELSRIVPLNINIASQVQDRSANLLMMLDLVVGVGGCRGGGGVVM